MALSGAGNAIPAIGATPRSFISEQCAFSSDVFLVLGVPVPGRAGGHAEWLPFDDCVQEFNQVIKPNKTS